MNMDMYTVCIACVCTHVQAFRVFDQLNFKLEIK